MARREHHLANVRSYSSDGIRQILAGYQGHYAAIQPGFEFKPGFIYAQVRAIAARINQNFDGWPSSELKKSYRSFIGKPCFVNHQNFDPKKARGKVIAARYRENGKDKYVETVMEIDAQRFPRLAAEIKSGGLDSVSMGVEAGFTICSYCGNKAVDVPDFCSHVKYHKGQVLPKINIRTGAKEDILVYEKCFKLGFFELSFVFDPADETAVVTRVLAASRIAQDQQAMPPDEIVEGQMPTPMLPTPMMPQARRRRRADTAPSGAVPPAPGTSAPDIHTLPSVMRPNTPFYGEDPLKGPNTNPSWYRAPFSPTVPPRKAVTPPGQGIPSGYEAGNTAARRYGYGEITAPEDIDTLRQDDEDDDYQHFTSDPVDEGRINALIDQAQQDLGMAGGGREQAVETGGPESVPGDEDIEGYEDDGTEEFKHYVPSPKELRGPNLDQTKRLDRVQEQEGLDADRRVEDVEDVEGVPMPRNARRRRTARRRHRASSVLLDPRTGRRYIAADEPPPDFGGGDEGPDDSDEGDLIQEAEEDLQHAEAEDYEGDEDEDEEPDEDEEEPEDDEEDEDEGPPPDFGGGGGDEGPEEEEPEGGGEQPPWLKGGNYRSSAQKKRRARKGQPMSLAKRGQVVASRQLRRHYADESGHVDGGPYHTDDNDLGEQEEVFISQVPGAEAVAAPTPGDGTISNTENNLVASLSRRIQHRNAEQRRDMIAWEQITGQRIAGEVPESFQKYIKHKGEDGKQEKESRYYYGQESVPHVNQPGTGGTTGGGYGGGVGGIGPQQSYGTGGGTEDWLGKGTAPSPGYGGGATGGGIGTESQSHLHQQAQRRRSRRYYGEAVEQPDEVDPTVRDPAGEELTGDDFESLTLDHGLEVSPKDAASHRAFRAFDNWLTETTGRTARQHGNPHFIRRQAARFCQASGIRVEALFPALGTVLREARRNERSAMRRYADESLDVAAPQDRIDVEAPVRDTTDADAQASQFDLGDFGDNAGDNLADPELESDSQIWAPGETPAPNATKSSAKADGITAVRYAEAFITAGLAPNTPEEKWKIAGLAQTMRHGTIVDRIRLLDAVNLVQRTARRTAGVRGAPRGLPPGLGGRQMTAASQAATTDIATDSAMFFK
jgi:hypothetical protein